MVDVMAALRAQGFLLLRGVFTPEEAAEITVRLQAALGAVADASAIRSRGQSVYAGRNLFDWFPQAKRLWDRPPLQELLANVLGERGGLVRGLFFDKPPDQAWSLPWHRDRTIAVRDNRLPSSLFTHPTVKAGVPHVEAPVELLRQMLTLRIHLDAADEQNGALQVLPGSHQEGTSDSPPTGDGVLIAAAAGDVLAMRPLLSHCSGSSLPGVDRRRRILHFEFAPSPDLPDGFVWHDFERVQPTEIGCGIAESREKEL
ncbi:phytanoyl-CoA dioxygenase family protein [Lignipirellula cremea]|uniref:Phytanoyl-CoA dioxygenase (PhyH) n=1 Tax=Lignipirellula cremea TaxID=2528010 RepID=A0A518DZ96_9BACT|nr:phytanoyl-CoA dioxygenase family protein [Lignipirellula cremea]QDU97159.1 Phytanoyl-CoA dioxygenase (PhyH) [Lignipirellula cremea]